jgi:hypothetical protein
VAQIDQILRTPTAASPLPARATMAAFRRFDPHAALAEHRPQTLAALAGLAVGTPTPKIVKMRRQSRIPSLRKKIRVDGARLLKLLNPLKIPTCSGTELGRGRGKECADGGASLMTWGFSVTFPSRSKPAQQVMRKGDPLFLFLF